MGSLTAVGYAWALLSLSAAVLCCSGVYLPYWIQGRLLGRVDAYFNSFRRCNYPKGSPQGGVDIIMQCARYSRWRDIPSGWWQASTVLVTVSCMTSVLVAVVAVSGCCLSYVIHDTTARVAGWLQCTAGLLMCGGAAVYPLGLDSREVRDCCGTSAHAYSLGSCRVSWSVYLLSGAVVLLISCFALSPYITRDLCPS